MVWGARHPLSLVPSPLFLGPGWTLRFGGSCLRIIHFLEAPLFADGAGFGGWLGVWAGLSPVSHLITSMKNNAKKRKMFESFIESVPLLKSLEVKPILT